MRWLISYFLAIPEKVSWIFLLIGFTTGFGFCITSESTHIETIKKAIPFAVLINSATLIHAMTTKDKEPINRAEILFQYMTQKITTKNILQKYGGLMACCCIVFFWLGWFSFGLLSAVLTILFEGR